jgi:hypothetical protein
LDNHEIRKATLDGTSSASFFKHRCSDNNVKGLVDILVPALRYTSDEEVRDRVTSFFKTGLNSSAYSSETESNNQLILSVRATAIAVFLLADRMAGKFGLTKSANFVAFTHLSCW